MHRSAGAAGPPGPDAGIGRRRLLALAGLGLAGVTSACTVSGDSDVASPVRKVAQELLSVVGTAQLVIERFVADDLPGRTALVTLSDAERTCRQAVDKTHQLKPVSADGIALCRRALELGAAVRSLLNEVGAAIRADDVAATDRLRAGLQRQHETLDALINELAGSG